MALGVTLSGVVIVAGVWTWGEAAVGISVASVIQLLLLERFDGGNV